MSVLNAIPRLNTIFMELNYEAFEDGALSSKMKELIAIAVSLAVGCGKCAASHTAAARQFGATDEEIREAIAVAEVIAAGAIRVLASELDGDNKPSVRQSCCG
jgi:AhpD family alkylhydroperoxidase